MSTTVLDHRAQLGDRGLRIDRHRDKSGTQRGEVGNNELDAVRTDKGNPMSRDQAMRRQAGGHGIDPAVEVCPSHSAAYRPRLDEGDLVGTSRQLPLHKISEIRLQPLGVDQLAAKVRLGHAPESDTIEREADIW
jgi:hypothetical protein